MALLPAGLVGDDIEVPCADGSLRRYLSLDAAASTPAHPDVARAVSDFLPWYSSVHRGAGFKSQRATNAYERAREQILAFAGRSGTDDVAIICRNTTEAINHLAYRLRLDASDVVLTTVVEHHANLLPWARVATRRFVECGTEGTFSTEDVVVGLDERPKPSVVAITAASNVTGWQPPLGEIIAAAHDRGVPVLVDGAQLAAHRPLPTEADYVVFSGHKMYAPFGAGALIGPRAAFDSGDPYLAGGGAVELVDLDEVVWSAPPEREEAGSPNVLGAVALGEATNVLGALGFSSIGAHDDALSAQLHDGLAQIPGVAVLGPGGGGLLPVATFLVRGVPHALVAARLSAEFAIGVRHGCFCAHPYLVRLLGLDPSEVERFRVAARHHERWLLPGAVRASTGLSTTTADVDRFLGALATIAGSPPSYRYVRDPGSGDYWPEDLERGDGGLGEGAGCASG